MLNQSSLSSVTFVYTSENSLLLQWQDKICQVQHQQIIDCQKNIKHELGEYLVDTVASYHCLMIYYQFEKISIVQLEQAIKALFTSIEKNIDNQLPTISGSIIEIPVYYGEDSGWDLAQLAKKLSLSIEEIITLHSERLYRAFAFGFIPGFCYLATLDDKLQQPRLSSPRTIVPKGAVAIAEKQTAIYPDAGPGGWHIIGQTPLPLYDVVNANEDTSQDKNFLPVINIGQQVRFKPISYQTFCQLGGELSLVDSLADSQISPINE